MTTGLSIYYACILVWKSKLKKGELGMKKVLKIIVIILAAAFIGIQFFRTDVANPQINEADTLQTSMQVPSDVDAILTRSCGDCHSYKTVYPWYAHVAPVSWWLSNHISEGRRELNMSVWNTYSPKKKANKLKEICEQVEQGEMPLPSYLWIHRDAVLKEGEAKALCDWVNAERARIDTGAQPTN